MFEKTMRVKLAYDGNKWMPGVRTRRSGRRQNGGYIMKNASLLLFALLGALAARPAEDEKLVAQVRAAETALAQAMAARAHDSFASHIADEALFFSKQG